MSQNRVSCPECDAVLALAATVAPGKKITCPKCKAVFPVPDPEIVEVAPESAEVTAAPRRRFKKRKQGMAAGLLASIIAASILLVGGVAFGGYMLLKPRSGSSAKVHKDVMPPSGQGTSIGQLTPEIAGEDLDGKAFKLSDYRGKVVVLDFWGHW